MISGEITVNKQRVQFVLSYFFSAPNGNYEYQKYVDLVLLVLKHHFGEC